MNWRYATLAVLLPAVVALAGCGGGDAIGRYNVLVSVDENYVDEHKAMPSLEVHIRGLNNSELSRWNTTSVSDYFAGARPSDKTVVMKFGEDLPKSEQKLDRKDPVWEKWESQGATYLVVLANLPGVRDGEAGGADPRKVVMPLRVGCWESGARGKWTSPISISAPPEGVVCLRRFKLSEGD